MIEFVARSQKYVFLLLIASQCVHSVEEVYFGLWRVFEPARVVSGLLSSDLERGFTIANVLVISAGTISALYLFRSNGSWSKMVILFWVTIELINFGVHAFMAFRTGGYFPGVYTAPFLLLFSGLLVIGLANQVRHHSLT